MTRCDCTRWMMDALDDCACPFLAEWVTRCEHVLCQYCLFPTGTGRWQCDGCGQVVTREHFTALKPDGLPEWLGLL